MTQQLWEVPSSPAKPPIPQAIKIIAAIGAVILILGGFNLYSGMHDKHPAPSPLALKQLRPVFPPPVDPDDFNEARDGTKELSLEDVNGTASIWEDSKSGARVFCLNSCIVLPRPRHHHRNP